MEEIQAQLAVKKNPRPHMSETGLSWILIILALVLFALAVTIFQGEVTGNNVVAGPTPTAVQSTMSRVYTVSHKSGVFSPTNLRIHAGDTVRFRNDGILPIRIVSDPHPGHNDYSGFDSIGDIPPTGSFSFTFAAKGTFGYHNEDSLNESATIIVR